MSTLTTAWRYWSSRCQSATPLPLWLAVAGLVLLATLMYWLAPGQERFEQWLALPAPPVLPAWVLSLLSSRHYLPDFAWAALVACAGRDLFWSLQSGLPRLFILLVAAGWELAQWLSLVPGHFDPTDLLLSVLAAGIVLLVPAKGEQFCGHHSSG